MTNSRTEDRLLAALAVPPHTVGTPFVATSDEERDTELLAHADAFCARYGVDHSDLGDDIAEAHYRRFKRQLDAEMALHDRYMADLQRRRVAYGYGLIGRIREWWGERRPNRGSEEVMEQTNECRWPACADTAECQYANEEGCSEQDKTVPIAAVLGEDWELPEGFVWEYRDGLDGGGSHAVGPDGERHSEVILPTRYRRAVGPWEVVRERTRI